MSENSKVELVVEESKALIEKTLEELLIKWNIMYNLTDEIRDQKFHQFMLHLKEFFNEMLLSEETRRNHYVKEVDKKLKECKDLEKALHVTINCDIAICEAPLTDVIKHLENSLKDYEELKKQRLEKLNKLRVKEGNLCRLIGSPILEINNAIPSDEDIERLEHNIFILEEEKIRRTEQYYKFRDQIVDYIEKLEVSTLLDFEKTIIDSDQIASLKLEDLEKIKEVESSYKQQFESAKVKVEYMYNELEKLWNRLDIDEDYRSNFHKKHQGVGRKTVDYIQREIHRCEKLKKELIEPLIKKTRSQILSVCDKLCYSEEQCAKYDSYGSSHCSEDLLDILELELSKLEMIYNDSCEIIQLAKKHQDLWNRMLELEEAAKDKNRLFNNRGGQLLKEEKERKTIEQSLPKIHKKLEDFLVDYEDRKNEPFLLYGVNLLDKIRDDLEQRNLNRQNKVAKKNDTKVMDSASKAREKRKLNGHATPKSENSKRIKLAGSTLSLASSASKASSAKSVDGRRCGTRSRVALFKDQDTSVASSYSMFQDELEEKKRSVTMCNTEREPLKDVNSPAFPVHSSPSGEVNESRFNFRPRANEFKATSKSAIPTPAPRGTKTPAKNAYTPISSKRFATPKTVTRSTTKLATPKNYLSSRTPAKANTPKTRNFFETPSSASKMNQKSLSIIKPAKFKFDF